MHNLMGDAWQIVVYYKGYPAFEIAKEFDIKLWRPRFAGRIKGGNWQQFDTLDLLLKMMCTKHRIGVGE